MDHVTTPIAFTPSRAAGLDRLAAFLPSAGAHYRDRRNHDYGAADRSNVSALSPWVRHRLVSEEEICRRVLAAHAYSSAEKFIQEVLWRTYWKGWLELRPSVWSAYVAERDRAFSMIAAEGGLRRAYEAAVSGRSGIDCLDAWARELVETGYLHNHTRMWFASIWIFTLRLPWTLGADFFLRHLIDGDPASNTLSWRWVAGLQTRGKTYVATADNIARYTDGRFRPEGLASNPAPLEETMALPAALPLQPGDIAAREPSLLLVTEEDGQPETLTGLPGEIAGAVGLTVTEGRSPQPVGTVPAGFAEAALGDALARAGFAGAAVHGSGEALEAILAAAAEAKVRQVVTAHAPVGPVQAVLDGLKPELAARGIALKRIRRDWDSRAWPHATRGFFAFKENIPALLEAAGIGAGGKRRR